MILRGNTFGLVPECTPHVSSRAGLLCCCLQVLSGRGYYSITLMGPQQRCGAAFQLNMAAPSYALCPVPVGNLKSA